MKTTRKVFKTTLLIGALLLSGCASIDKASTRVTEIARTAVGLANPVKISDHGDFQLVRLLAKVGQPGNAMAVTNAPAARGEMLYLVDGQSLRQLDLSTLQWVELSVQADTLIEPSGVFANSKHLLVLSEKNGLAWKIDRQSGEIILEIKDLNRPRSMVELSDGSLLITEAGTAPNYVGVLTMISGPKGDQRTTLASGLIEPSGMVATVGGVYITETGTGSVLRLDPVTGRRSVLVSGLKKPHGITLTTTGRLAVLESQAKQITILDPVNGAATVRANQLPVASDPAYFAQLSSMGSESLLLFQ